MKIAAKTASWSITHLVVAVAVAYAVTQDWRAAMAVGLVEPIFQTIAYMVHERFWTRVDKEERGGTIRALAGSAAA